MAKYYDLGTYKFSLIKLTKSPEYYQLVVFDVERKDKITYYFSSKEKAMEEILSYAEIDADDFE